MRIHGELLKLGIDIGATSVSQYLMRPDKPPSQSWRTFLDKQVRTMVSVDFFTVPAVRFQALYVFLELAHERRRVLHFGVTAHPTAEWTAQQLRSRCLDARRLHFGRRRELPGQNKIQSVRKLNGQQLP